MRIQLLHTLLVCLIATAAGLFGLSSLIPDALRSPLAGWVVMASCFLWLLFGNLYLHSPVFRGTTLYFGVLSPFLGCLLVGPPWSFLFVFSEPVFSVSLGIGTSLAVCSVSRWLAAWEE